jgi:hypothetical protein
MVWRTDAAQDHGQRPASRKHWPHERAYTFALHALARSGAAKVLVRRRSSVDG